MPTKLPPNNTTLRIAVNGVVHHLDANDLLSKRPYLKLSEYLREDLHLTGTKVACGEGGCGGCTVLITRVDGNGGLTTISCNACLAPLTSLHNAAITTVEGIYDASSPSSQQQQKENAGADGDYNMYDHLTVPSGIYEPITTANAGPDVALSTRVEGRRPHPIQQRFASYNASQCGFCTPGFVMAVCGFLCKQGSHPSSSPTTPSPSFQLADIEDALDGNLCRCTGYRPILEAAAGTAITECHGDRKPDAACAKCVSCPRAQQCLPDGAHENTLEEARGVLKLVEGSFPFLDTTTTTSSSKHVTTTLLPPKMPVAPQTVAARSNTITAAIQGGKPVSALLDVIPVTSGSATTSANPPAAFGYHTFPRTVEDLVFAIQNIDSPDSVSLVAAQTSAGVYPKHLPVKINKAAVAADSTTPSVISIQYVDELCRVEPWVGGGGEEGITVGAATTISQLIGHLLYQALWLHSTGTNDNAKMNILRAATIMKAIAGTHVRDVATIGGNLNMCRNLGFASDLATPLCALNAVATVVDVTHGAGGASVRRTLPLLTFLTSTPNPKTTTVLVSVSIPLVNVSTVHSAHMSVYFHRVATRSANAYATLNAACTIHQDTSTITGVSLVLGNAGVMDVPFGNAPKVLPTEQLTSLLVGKPLSTDTIEAFKSAFHVPNGVIEGNYKVAARVMLVKAFIVASLEEAANTISTASNNTKSYTQLYPSDQGHVYNPTTSKHSEPTMVVGRPISKPDGILHATGTTTYLTDISPPKGTLYMSIVMSTVPSGIVKKFGTDALIPLQALDSNGENGEDVPHQPIGTVVANAEEPTTALILPDQKRHQLPMFIGAADLPKWALNRHPDIGGHLGEQDRNGAFPGGYYDFPLVANRLIAYCDQPMGVVIGRTLKEAELGAKAVAAATTYEDAVPSDSPTFPSHLPKVPSILGGRYEGLPIAAIRKHSITIPGTATTQSDDASTTTTVDFETVLLGQKHFYMENQACLVIPADGATRTKVHLAVHGVQHAAEYVAKAAGYAMNQVEIVQHRMGGSFGGKTNVVHACLAAILSRMYHRPVMVALDRITDMRFQGGREEMQIRSKVVTTIPAPSSKSNEFHHIDYHSLHNQVTDQTIPRIMSVDTTTHADVGARVGFSNYTLGHVMPYSIMRCYSPSVSVNNTAIGYLTQSCERTNVRSPGHAEAAIITEAIIDRVAAAHNVHSQVVREANFLGSDVALVEPYSKSMYTFPGLYKKMMAVGASSTTSGDTKDGWATRINATIDFNKQHVGGRYKKGAAVVPFEYPVGGGQYSAMVVVLPDGSVAVHHSGVEMGQGLVIKSLQAANQELSKILYQLCEGVSDENGNPKQMSALPMSMFQSAGNSSHVLPKHGITGGSTSSEGSVDAVVEAAKKIAEILEPFVCMLFGSEIDVPEDEVADADDSAPITTVEDDVLGEYTSLAQTTGASNTNSTIRQLQLLRSQLRRGEFETHTLWARLVALANSMGANITATAMNGEDSGSSSYSIYCVGGAEVTVDTYTGAVVVDRVDIMYDAGRSLNPAVDIGQIEGAFMMGLGYMLTEENAHHDTITGGEVSGGSTWNYKVPSIRELPTQFNVQLMSPGDLDRWILVNREGVAAKSKKDDSQEEEAGSGVTTTSTSNGGKGLVMSSKATGEPPLCIAPCLLSAVRQAVQSSRLDKDLGGYPAISVPYTPDKVVRACGAV